MNITLNNIDVFDTYEDMTKAYGYNKEDFLNLLIDNINTELTQGTYNATSDTFVPLSLTDENLRNTLISYLHDTDYSDIYEDNEDTNLAYTDNDYLQMLLNHYEIFAILEDNNIYLIREF